MDLKSEWTAQADYCDEGLIIVVTSVIDATSGGDGNYRRATRLARWTVATIHPAQRRPREMEIK